jgi:drug/metabolite transporter (DMT)-like permease
MPDGAGSGVNYVMASLRDPLVALSLLLAFIAALFWIAALSHLSLGVAYPFMSLAFVFVVLVNASVLHDPVSVTRWFGVGVVVLGLTLVARG